MKIWRAEERNERVQLEEALVAMEGYRDLALGRARAQRDRIASWLEQRADAYDKDATDLSRLKARPLAANTNRAIATELRNLAARFMTESESWWLDRPQPGPGDVRAS